MKKKPFFSRFLTEQQLENVNGGTGGKGGPITVKFPSDSDEAQTMKYPSDDDEVVSTRQ